MKGKLIKKEGGYCLIIPGESTNKFIASIDGMYVDHILSLKNCQAIERGYDLEHICWQLFGGSFEARNVESEEEADKVVNFGIECFQKALELMGDKKFSEEDIKRAFIQGAYAKTEIHRKKEEYIQSLQQTEWEVEIVMGTHCRQIDCVNKGELIESKIVKDDEVPILDADGCLILKRSI